VEAEGLELLENFTFEANTNDFTDTILRVKQPIRMYGSSLATPIPAVRQALKEQVIIPRWYCHPGFWLCNIVLPERSYPALADGIIFTMDFAPVSKLPVPEEFKTSSKSTRQDLGGTYNTTYASTWLLADALEKACLDRSKAIAETLRTTKFEGGKWASNGPPPPSMRWAA